MGTEAVINDCGTFLALEEIFRVYPVAGAGGPQPTIKPGSRATTTAAP
jgi:hypothetical protein